MLVALPCARADEGEQRREAGKLYAEAQDAAMAANYARAAELFERANELLPSPQALRAAIQVYLAADQPLLAIARAEELLRRYPYDLTSRSLALETIDRLSSRFVRVLVTCDAECTVQTDEREQPTEPGRSHIVYVAAGSHAISARFDDGTTLTKNIRRGAGQAVSLDFDRPLAGVTEPGTEPAGSADTGAGEERGAGAAGQATGDGDDGGDRSTGMPMGAARMQSENTPAVDRIEPPLVPLLIGGAVTAGLGAVAVWSHRDALAAGQGDPASAEQRTRILVGATALSAASTLAVSIVWARLVDDDQPAQRDGARLGMSFDTHGYWVGMGGRF